MQAVGLLYGTAWVPAPDDKVGQWLQGVHRLSVAAERAANAFTALSTTIEQMQARIPEDDWYDHTLEDVDEPIC